MDTGIFGPKRDEVTGGWRGLHNEDLHNFYLRQIQLGDQVKEDYMGRARSTNGDEDNCGEAKRKETTRKTKT
jgi:hypothetical protein